jgi:hypothetical protein
MKPRYEADWIETGEYFAGYANELDVWVEFPNGRNEAPRPIVLVVAPEHLVIGTSDYDCYEVEDGVLVFRDSHDVHTTPYDMALIYQIATQEGVLGWKPEAS